jgi:AcrR family transcriptional regulator
MAEPAPATENNEARRIQMLRAAAELICERGFSETRIADVAKRAGVSSALVIYYFGTRDRLLVDALRYSEESFYSAAEQMLAEVTSLRERISLLIRWTCVPEGNGEDEIPGAWGLWFDLWAQAFRHDEVKAGRIELDARWRRMIIDALEVAGSAELVTKIDPVMFALEFSALLDGLSIQVALEDPEVDSEVAYQIAMGFAERELDLPAEATTAKNAARKPASEAKSGKGAKSKTATATLTRGRR